MTQIPSHGLGNGWSHGLSLQDVLNSQLQAKSAQVEDISAEMQELTAASITMKVQDAQQRSLFETLWGFNVAQALERICQLTVKGTVQNCRKAMQQNWLKVQRL
jgi:ribosomal protein S3